MIAATGSGQEYEKWRVWNNGLGIAKMFVFANGAEVDVTKIRHRWDEIGDSLKNSSSPFAGTYIQTGDSGYFLRWSPEKGFVFAYYHEYFVKDATYGRVVVSPTQIEFIVDPEIVSKDIRRKLIIPTAWVPAYGGKFLVKKDEVDSFGRFYGGFGEFNGYPRKWFCDCGPFAVRSQEELHLTAEPRLILPPSYKRSVRPPIGGQIVGVGKPYLSRRPVSENSGELASVTPITLNCGSKDGMKRNMFLFLETDIEGTHEIIKVLKVTAIKSSAIVIREIDDKHQENYPDWNDDSPKPRRLAYSKLRVGMKVSTRFQETLLN